MERQQINFRLDKDLTERLDKRRVELMKTLGYIPTRSDILRMALIEFLGVSGSAKVGQRAKTAKVKKDE